MAIWGWMTPVELRWLGEQAARMRSVVEVGSLHGRSAFALLTACPGTVWCIDPWDDDADRSYGSFISACGHFPNLRAIRAKSPDAADEIPDVDMVFIDGAHDYESVTADIKAWQPKTVRLLCGHDYFTPVEAAGFPGVPQAVNHLLPDAEIAAETSIWYVEI